MLRSLRQTNGMPGTDHRHRAGSQERSTCLGRILIQIPSGIGWIDIADMEATGLERRWKWSTVMACLAELARISSGREIDMIATVLITTIKLLVGSLG